MNELPEVKIGSAEEQVPPAVEDDEDPDDELLAKTPEGIIRVLGFDPLEDEDEDEDEDVKTKQGQETRPFAAGGFDESEHPRAPEGTSEGGQFVEKGGGGGAKGASAIIAKESKRLRAMGVDDSGHKVELRDEAMVTPPGGGTGDRWGYHDRNTGRTVLAADKDAVGQDESAALGGEVVDSSLAGVYRHETGHYVYNKIGAFSRAEWEGIAHGVDDASKVSGVAAQDDEELFCEAFSYKTSRDWEPGVLPLGMDEFFDIKVLGSSA